MAHTKAKGTSKLGRDSRAKRLGVKVFGGQKINAGMIIVRQRGSKFYAGEMSPKERTILCMLKKKGLLFSQKLKLPNLPVEKLIKL